MLRQAICSLALFFLIAGPSPAGPGDNGAAAAPAAAVEPQAEPAHAAPALAGGNAPESAAASPAPSETPKPQPRDPVAEDRKSLQLEEELKKLEELDKEYRRLHEETQQLQKSLRSGDGRPLLPAAAASEEASKPAAAKEETPKPAPPQAEAAKPVPELRSARIVTGSEEKLANALYRLGRFKDAQEAYERALQLAASNEAREWCTFQLGMCLLRLGSEDAAVEQLNKTFRNYPEGLWGKQAQWQLDSMRWATAWTKKSEATEKEAR